RTAFWSVASPHPRAAGAARALAVGAMLVQRGADQVRVRRVSRSGRIATVVKAVQRRGPGRVVLGSKPQLATTEKLVCWAGDSTQARSLRLPKNSCAGLRATRWGGSPSGSKPRCTPG